jgi:hypothetical protein
MKLIRAALLILSAAGGAQAANIDKVKEAANDFSHENLICGAYYMFVAQCLKNKNESDPLSAQYMSGAQTFLKRGIETGKIADLSDKAIEAKVSLAIEAMKDDTENNCVNISVLFQKHAKSCKATFEQGPEILTNRLNKLGVK